MASLYEIDERLKVLEEYQVDSSTGEILSDEEFYKLFDEIQMALTDKIESTICFAKNLEADVEAFKAEEKRLAERRKAKENLAGRLKKRIDDYITWQFTDDDGNVDYEKLNKYKLETPKMKLSYRKSDKAEVFDNGILPKEFVKVETTEKPMLAEIKKAIKNGGTVEGARLVTNYNMQIK